MDREKLSNESPSSLLHPSITKSIGLVRLTATPVFAPSNVDRKQADGVLISGDLVNGKLAINERALDILRSGEFYVLLLCIFFFLLC